MADRAALIVDLETAPIEDAEQYLTDPVSAPANYKDPEKIASYIADARQQQLGKCALDPDLCRMVAIGWCYSDRSEPVVMGAENARTERWLLEQFWDNAIAPLGGIRTLITFNGHRFDLPVLMRRSLYLGIRHPALNIDKYRSPHKDLMSVLTYNGVLQAHSLKFYCARFGIPVDDVLTGKDIGQLVKDGKWADVLAHCKADVLATKALATRLGVLPAVEAVAQGAF